MLEPGLQTMDQTATLLEIWRIMLNELARESISESIVEAVAIDKLWWARFLLYQVLYGLYPPQAHPNLLIVCVCVYSLVGSCGWFTIWQLVSKLSYVAHCNCLNYSRATVTRPDRSPPGCIPIQQKWLPFAAKTGTHWCNILDYHRLMFDQRF